VTHSELEELRPYCVLLTERSGLLHHRIAEPTTSHSSSFAMMVRLPKPNAATPALRLQRNWSICLPLFLLTAVAWPVSPGCRPRCIEGAAARIAFTERLSAPRLMRPSLRGSAMRGHGKPRKSARCPFMAIMMDPSIVSPLCANAYHARGAASPPQINVVSIKVTARSNQIRLVRLAEPAGDNRMALRHGRRSRCAHVHSNS
jgi:hypothetical protein